MKRICCSLLLALGLAAPAGADAPPAASPSPAVAAPPAGVSYHLTFEDGRPILDGYEFGGITIRPALDTGSPLTIYLPNTAFKSWVERCGNQKCDLEDLSLVQLPALGSGRLRWMPADSEDGLTLLGDHPAQRTDCDSLFPLDMLDGNCDAFLLSQSRLWIGDIAPNTPKDAKVEALIVPYLEWMDGIFVMVKGRHHCYPLQIDTGSNETMFDDSLRRREPTMFGPGQARADGSFAASDFNGRLRRLKRPLTIMGQTAEADALAIPAGDYVVGRETAQADDPEGLAAGSKIYNTPFERSDGPDIEPVGVLGMDVLGKYDFMLLRREKLLVLWDPKFTAAVFPLPAGQQ